MSFCRLNSPILTIVVCLAGFLIWQCQQRDLAPATNTLLTEFEIDNKNGELKPGSYAEVHMMLAEPGHRLLVPVSSVLFRPEGPQVGTVENGHVKLNPVALGKDFGNTIELLSGIAETDSVIDNPSDSLANGMAVRVVGPNASE